MKKIIDKFNDFSKLEKKRQIILITTLLTVIAYGAACTKALYHSNNKILEKQEPQGLKDLRPGLDRVSVENDPLLREYRLQEEAAKSNKTVNDYRSLFESYRNNKLEFLPEYPQQKWSILAWGFWYFQRVTPQKRVELVNNSLLFILEKVTLITAVIGVGKWLLESPQRRKQGQHEAWQIIHMAEQNTVSGARITALEDLNRQKVSLAGLELELANKDLQGICLKEANLSGANLSGANLSKANLSKANLSKADLNTAALSFADLRGANLTEANLSGAELIGTDLTEANLSSADLTGAKLMGADLTRANLKGAALTDDTNSGLLYLDSKKHTANLTNANLSSADLRGAYLMDANLTGANLTNADLRNADFEKEAPPLPRFRFMESNYEGKRQDLPDLSETIIRQIKAAKNWKLAKYSPKIRALLDLPPETTTSKD